MPAHPTICRFCHANCALLVDVEEGRPVRVRADRENPVYHGYACAKGKQLAAVHAPGERLLHSQRRRADGGFEAVASAAALDEIAARVRSLVARHGPRSVAIYLGTYAGVHPASAPFAVGWLLGLGSRLVFSASSILANAVHGRWLGGSYTFDESDVWMLVGNNPLVSISGGIPPANPGQRLKRARERGMRLVAIDPRRSELARQADITLQPRPGEDPALLAAMLHVIFAEGLEDAAFLAGHTQGREALRAAVAPFTPALAAARADVPAALLVDAARAFAQARRACAVAGTGPNMSPHGTLTEYLLLCLNSVCGHWRRAGERVPNPGALLPRAIGRAEAEPPRRGWGFGEKLRVRGLGGAACGLPTAALADEILLEGEGQIRALFAIGGNPLLAWPDQQRTLAAMRKLELLVCLDRKLSETARLAHYVVAPKLALEVPGLSLSSEALEQTYVAHGYSEPYAQYAPALVEPPPGSDVIAEWEAFVGLAQRLGTPLRLTPVRPETGVLREARPGCEIDTAEPPSADEVLALLTANSRVPLEEVKRHPHGALFEDPPAFVAAAEADAAARLELGHAELLAELAGIARQSPALGRPFRLISRRLPNAYNSSGRDLAALSRGRRYNPAYLHPDDLAALGAASGDRVRIRSDRAAILAIAEAAPELRRGVVSLAHGFGGEPEREDVRRDGASVARLVDVEDCFDPRSGIPRMSALPVSVERCEPG